MTRNAVIDNFEEWLDEPTNQGEPWPPTRESLGRFCASTGALVGSEVETVWAEYSKDGFRVVHEDGSIHRC